MAECGSCTMCCKLLGVEELKKPAFQWCQHCAVGKGCRIYADRPPTCAEYECLYRTAPAGTKLSDPALRPDRCKVVIAGTTNPHVISAHVDPGYRDAWQKEPVYTLLKNLAEGGIRVVITWDNRPEKISLMGVAPGVVRKERILMSEPDEKGMQWFYPKEDSR